MCTYMYNTINTNPTCAIPSLRADLPFVLVSLCPSPEPLNSCFTISYPYCAAVTWRPISRICASLQLCGWAWCRGKFLEKTTLDWEPERVTKKRTQ